jgi:hypothetical protein
LSVNPQMDVCIGPSCMWSLLFFVERWLTFCRQQPERNLHESSGTKIGQNKK